MTLQDGWNILNRTLSDHRPMRVISHMLYKWEGKRSPHLQLCIKVWHYRLLSSCVQCRNIVDMWTSSKYYTATTRRWTNVVYITRLSLVRLGIKTVYFDPTVFWDIYQGSNQALLACRADTLSFAAATLLVSPTRCRYAEYRATRCRYDK